MLDAAVFNEHNQQQANPTPAGVLPQLGYFKRDSRRESDCFYQLLFQFDRQTMYGTGRFAAVRFRVVP